MADRQRWLRWLECPTCNDLHHTKLMSVDEVTEEKAKYRIAHAAPDLLEACKMAISWLAPSPDAEYLADYPEMVRMIETAIAKAENDATKGNA